MKIYIDKKVMLLSVIVICFVLFINFFIVTYIGCINDKFDLTFSKVNFKNIMNYYKKDVLTKFEDLDEHDNMTNINFTQQTNYTCGAAALRYLLYYYFKIDISEKELAKLVNTNESGSSLYDMSKGLNKLGLQGVGVSANYARLKNMKKPVIAFINNNHYVVILDIKGNYIYAFDPAVGFGHMKAHKDNFLDLWNGILLIVKPQEIESYQKEVN